jgi:hypothetical protein
MGCSALLLLDLSREGIYRPLAGRASSIEIRCKIGREHKKARDEAGPWLVDDEFLTT